MCVIGNSCAVCGVQIRQPLPSTTKRLGIPALQAIHLVQFTTLIECVMHMYGR
jgi:hypothetical protein